MTLIVTKETGLTQHAPIFLLLGLPPPQVLWASAVILAGGFQVPAPASTVPLSSLHTLPLELVYLTGHTHSHLFLHSDLPSELQTQIPNPGWHHLLNVLITPQNHHVHTDLSKPSLLEFSLSNNFRVCTVLSRFSHVQLFVTPWTVAHRDPLSMRFSRQEYWSGLLLCPSPGHLPKPGIKPVSLISPALQDRFFTTSTTWEALLHLLLCNKPNLNVLARNNNRFPRNGGGGGGGHWIPLFTFL